MSKDVPSNLYAIMCTVGHDLFLSFQGSFLQKQIAEDEARLAELRLRHEKSRNDFFAERKRKEEELEKLRVNHREYLNIYKYVFKMNCFYIFPTSLSLFSREGFREYMFIMEFMPSQI